MRLITDHQIKMAAGKQFSLAVMNRINTIDHCLVRRENTVRIVVILFFNQIGTGQIRQQVHKTSFCLRNN